MHCFEINIASNIYFTELYLCKIVAKGTCTGKSMLVDLEEDGVLVVVKKREVCHEQG